MEATQFGGRNGSANGEPLVISRVDDGIRVYSVANPGQSLPGKRERRGARLHLPGVSEWNAWRSLPAHRGGPESLRARCQ